MVVAVLQPLAECTAIFTVCIVEHRPPPCAVAMHKTCTYQKRTHSKTVFAFKIKETRMIALDLTLPKLIALDLTVPW